MELPRDDSGKLLSYAWPGGYPIFYLDRCNTVMCPKCAIAFEEGTAAKDYPYLAPAAAGVHWEGAPIQCNDCGGEIESAYGEIEPAAGE